MFIKILLVIIIFGGIDISISEKPKSTGLFNGDYVINNGFPFEIHNNIKTEDGYLLQIHRIKHGRTNKNNNTKPIAFLMHGLGANSDSWMITNRKKALALLLADNGYDVWLGNARGTKYSKKHVNLHDNQTKFWDFSWHEIGLYDLPASLNYVLNYTKQEQLFYVGHSQGGTAFFVMNSFYPEMNRVVKLMIGMAPAVLFHMNGVNMTDRAVNLVVQFLNAVKNLFGITYFDYRIFRICRGYLLDMEKFCSYLYYYLSGINLNHLEKRMIALLKDEFPDSTTIKQMLHYFQLFISRSFKQYDYGRDKNLKIYNSTQPPLYDLKKTNCPVGIFYGIADTLVTPYNSRLLIKSLPNVVVNQFITEPDFSHSDFILHKNIDKILYNNLLLIMNNYTKH